MREGIRDDHGRKMKYAFDRNSFFRNEPLFMNSTGNFLIRRNFVEECLKYIHEKYTDQFSCTPFFIHAFL